MFPLVLLASVAAAGCDQDREAPADDLVNSGAQVSQADPPTTGSARTPPRTTGGAVEQSGNEVARAAAGVIPALLHGRWGLAPEDCTSPRGEANGLLVISADQLRFYESRAVPTADVTKAADSISGEFKFTGEGQSWTKFQALERRPEGLVRTERNPNASITYVRCD